LKIALTARFEKAWKELEDAERKQAAKALKNLEANIRHPALGVKKIKGVTNIWEARASRSLRFTFTIQGDVVILRNIGQHDETLNQP
jgi:mRNA interferase RelE/StbE